LRGTHIFVPRSLVEVNDLDGQAAVYRVAVELGEILIDELTATSRCSILDIVMRYY
jgi:hypothetical protein